MKKIVKLIKKYGIIGATIKVLNKISYRIFLYFNKMDIRCNEKYHKKQQKINRQLYSNIEAKLKDKKYKYVIVFYPYTEWALPIFQRPQQIALSMSKRDDILYFFCTTNYQFDNVNLFEQINENLYLSTEYDFLKKFNIKNRVIHLYSTDIVSKKMEIEEALKRGDKILYEYIDEIHEDITSTIPTYFFDKHNYILKNEKCYVVTTADKLYNDVKKVRNYNFILATNGVNLDDFCICEKGEEIPKKIVELKQKYIKLICYYGALAKWFDYELLAKCANTYPEFGFILIGLEYDDSLKKSKILNLNNVEYLGKIDYNKLFNYSVQMDLLTIPFLINDITKSTSPVKLFEYMATGKPILTTAMPECKKYKSVNVALTDKEFLSLIPKMFTLSQSEAYIQKLHKDAENNTWDKKSEDIISLLNKDLKESKK